MKKYQFSGHLRPTPDGMLPLQMSGEVYLAADVERLMAHQRRQLITFASDLVCGKLLPDIDADQFLKSTPVSVRRKVMLALEAAHEAHKVRGMELKKMSDASVPT